MKENTNAYWSTTPANLDLNTLPPQFTEAQQAKLKQMFEEERAKWKECPEYYKMYDKGRMPRK